MNNRDDEEFEISIRTFLLVIALLVPLILAGTIELAMS